MRKNHSGLDEVGLTGMGRFCIPLVFSLFVVATGFSQSNPPSSAPAPNQAATADSESNAGKAKTLLNQMVKALGGQAYLDAKDGTSQGRDFALHNDQVSGGGYYWRFWKKPDKLRLEVSKKRDIVEIYSGDEGHEITYKGVQAQDPKIMENYLRARQHSLRTVIEKWMNASGVAFFYGGQTIADQKLSDQVTIFDASNDSVILYLDVNSHLPIKKSFSWRNPADQLRDVQEDIYDNYHEIQGIMTPYNVTQYRNGAMTSQDFMNKASYNQGLQDSLFEIGAASKSVDLVPRK
ncbi:MAG: hypothetical protein M3O09_16410 [Acidobacteriota bacterium]|nr:hypothetical protein [Acidobacteriota bacterium]